MAWCEQTALRSLQQLVILLMQQGAKGSCWHTTPQASALRLLYCPGRPSAHCAACCTSSSLQAPGMKGQDWFLTPSMAARSIVVSDKAS